MNIASLLTSDAAPTDLSQRRRSISSACEDSTNNNINSVPHPTGLGSVNLLQQNQNVSYAMPGDDAEKAETGLDHALQPVDKHPTEIQSGEAFRDTLCNTADRGQSDQHCPKEDVPVQPITDTTSGALNQIDALDWKEPSKSAGGTASRPNVEANSINNACYCGREPGEDTVKPPFRCAECGKYFHQSCIEAIQSWRQECQPLVGDDFFYYLCKSCARGDEVLKRLQMTWVDVVTVTLFHLSSSEPSRKSTDDKHKYYGWKADICQFIDTNWDRFWLKSRTATWENTVASCLSTHKRFVQAPKQGHDQGLWALETMILPSSYDHSKRGLEAAWDIATDGSLLQPEQRGKAKRKRLEESDTDSIISAGKNRKKSRSNAGVAADGTKPRPKRRVRKKQTEDEDIDLATAIELYRDIDNPRAPVQMSNDTTHRAPQISVTDGGYTVSTDKGYRMGKATHGVWEGQWYCEVTVNTHEGHTRIGWSQISGDLQGPCGYDKFSYAFRDNPGTLFHMAKAKRDAPESYAVGYGPGDVIGMLINLPPVDTMDDLLRRLWDKDTPYVPFRSKPLTVADGSEIVYFKNGECLGVAYRDLFRGKYHPAISCYQGGSVTVNFGPEFRYPLPPGSRPFSEADTLPLWEDIQAGIVGWDEGNGSAEQEMKAEGEGTPVSTPGPLSSNEEEGDLVERDTGVNVKGRSTSIFVSDTYGEGQLYTMDEDEVSGIEALLSLGHASGRIEMPSASRSDDVPPMVATGSDVSSVKGRMQDDELAVEIGKKERKVVDMIRRSSMVVVAQANESICQSDGKREGESDDGRKILPTSGLNESPIIETRTEPLVTDGPVDSGVQRHIDEGNNKLGGNKME